MFELGDIRVLVALRHRLLADLLVFRLAELRLDTVMGTSDHSGVRTLVATFAPDIVLLDGDWETLSTAWRDARASSPRVILVKLEKEAPNLDAQTSIEQISLFDPASLLIRLLQANLSVDEAAKRARPETLASVSRREREVLSMIVVGKTNKAIGEALCISVRTVEHHRRNLMKKLGVRNVVELLAAARNLGSQ